jgi:putative chitinase
MRRYENNRNLGNTQPGDGCRFKGRGPMQLTGRWNYNACRRSIGADIVANPDLVASDPRIGFKAAAWFWTFKKLNRDADAMNVNSATKKINGGDNGIADRIARYNRAKGCIPEAGFSSRGAAVSISRT